MNPEIILASKSERRRQLLSEAGLEFKLMTPDIDEDCLCFKQGCAEALACEKARTVARRLRKSGSVIIAADTMVVRGRKIYEKPVDRNDARAILADLSGKSHLVVTGICVMDSRGEPVFSSEERTRVWFRRLSMPEIEAYLDTGEPFDKAGAYGIQGYGRFLVEKISGCFFNVVGLPIGKVNDFLKHFGIDLLCRRR
ncbi:MAG: Maf family protein [Candidatus Wallbacteria bacterium]|nr:Maf family protein [Candidatus Wallbacteria bacterium]